MRCANANELFRAMYCAVMTHRHKRITTDPVTAQPAETYEARIGSAFELHNPSLNVVTERRIDMKWAFANTLHFFADTEEADMLPRYNWLAEKYITNGRWIGAYGKIAMRQIDQCIALLQTSLHTRAAFVDMGSMGPRDVNRPACWNFLQFITGRYGLDMVCYQRSCNLLGVMPYDLIVLTNVLYHVASAVGVRVGSLCWHFGSLHCTEHFNLDSGGRRDESLLLNSYPRHICLDALRHPERYPWAEVLCDK
jgi:thymidylate synthase